MKKSLLPSSAADVLRRDTARAFTLIELITVIGIVLVLAALVVPAASKMTESAKLTKCLNVMKQWGTGFQLYMTDNDGKLPQAAEVADNADTQWQEKIAPYLVGNEGVVNKQRFIMRARYFCPADKQKGGIVYGGNTYLRPTQYGKAPLKLININAKKHDFMLLGENYTGEIWDPRPRTPQTGVDYARHKVGKKAVSNFLFADFHVEALSYQDTIDRGVICIPPNPDAL